MEHIIGSVETKLVLNGKEFAIATPFTEEAARDCKKIMAAIPKAHMRSLTRTMAEQGLIEQRGVLWPEKFSSKEEWEMAKGKD